MNTPDPYPISIFKAEDDADFENAFSIRRKVFGEEQSVPEEIDLDGHDAIAHHYIAVFNGQVCGTARWRITLGGKVKLERFAVLPEFRSRGVGKALVLRVLKDIPANREVYIHAQAQVIPFYQKLGFSGEGDIFYEADIPHQKMVFATGNQ